jgi:aminoglycoside phosphotransferase (APT) family kinase protein
MSHATPSGAGAFAGAGGRSIRTAVERLLALREPGARVLEVRELGTDADVSDATLKAAGYGAALRIRVASPEGLERCYVLHLAAANDYGHDRRSDRVAELLLAYDTYGELPRHARAVDVGVIAPGGKLVSLSRSGEPYLLTEWLEGRPYAEDLRAVAARGHAEPRDIDRARALARCLAELHVRVDRPASAYQRAVRDLLGHGEGIFGIVDGYPGDVPGAPPERLEAIERACLAWRWRLKGRSERLRRTHGDFHPFNVLFDDAGRIALLDTSRGSLGDPADDLAAMAVNFPFFAIDRPASWARGFAPLWHAFFDEYLARSGDREVLAVIAPFLAWRALVVASPRWYPHLPARARDRLLRLAEQALAAPRFDPTLADALMNEGER